MTEKSKPLAAFLLPLIFLLVSSSATDDDHFYSGFEVIRVQVTSRQQLELLANLEKTYDDEDFDIWGYPNVERQLAADISISPRVQSEVKAYLSKNGLQFTVSVADLQKAVDEEQEENEAHTTRRKKRSARNALEEIISIFPRYNREKLLLQRIAAAYPQYVELFILGNTHEKRNITGVKISIASNSTKKIVFVDGGIHAREHLSVAACNYLIYAIIDGLYRNESNIVKYLSKYDLVIVPLVNPDGYEMTHCGRRLWRKNKKPIKPGCVGVDVNRNFEMGYDVASHDEKRCHSNIFRGESAFSEKESQAIQKYVMRNRFRMLFYINLHAYSQYILFPWAFTSDKIDDYDELSRVAQAASDAIKEKFNETYQVGVPPALLYSAPGAAMDWVKSMGVKYCYAIEVRPGFDRGNDGFLATTDMIRPSGLDVYVALMAMLEAVETSAENNRSNN